MFSPITGVETERDDYDAGAVPFSDAPKRRTPSASVRGWPRVAVLYAPLDPTPAGVCVSHFALRSRSFFEV